MTLKKFQLRMGEKHISVSFFYNLDSLDFNPDLFYFTGYNGIGLLLVPHKGKPVLIVPQMEFERAHSIYPSIIPWTKGKKLFEIAFDYLHKKGIHIQKIGINKKDFTVLIYDTLKKYIKKVLIKDIYNLVQDVRIIKTETEIDILEQGCLHTDSIMQDCIELFKKKHFKTEHDVAIYLETRALAFGGISFKPIVASGKHAAQPHYEPGDVPLQRGFCVIDYGIKYKGYCTDITRTIFLGNPTSGEKKIYELVLKAQENAILSSKIGKKSSEINNELCKDLGKYSKYFIHGLGHGIGVEVHEAPSIGSSSMEVLRENMVFTIEPGVYVPNKFGIRIEDDVLLTKVGPQVLTKTKKKLISIP